MMGIFIRVEIDNQQIDPPTAGQLAAACPVDIFELRRNEAAINPEQEDECTLCRLCLEVAPPGAVKIHKLYAEETLVAGREL